MYISVFWRAISDQCTLAGLLVLELLPKVYQRICLSSNQQTHTIFVIQFSSTQSRNLLSFLDYGRHFKARANHTHSLFTFIIGAVGCEYSFRCVLPRDTRIRPQTDRMRALHTRARASHTHARAPRTHCTRAHTRVNIHTHSYYTLSNHQLTGLMDELEDTPGITISIQHKRAHITKSQILTSFLVTSARD